MNWVYLVGRAWCFKLMRKRDIRWVYMNWEKLVPQFDNETVWVSGDIRVRLSSWDIHGPYYRRSASVIWSAPLAGIVHRTDGPAILEFDMMPDDIVSLQHLDNPCLIDGIVPYARCQWYLYGVLLRTRRNFSPEFPKIDRRWIIRHLRDSADNIESVLMVAKHFGIGGFEKFTAAAKLLADL